MTCYEFPHTRNYDEDLGFLICKFNELIAKYDELIKIDNQIESDIQNIINQLFIDGKLSTTTEYFADSKTLKFYISNGGKI